MKVTKATQNDIEGIVDLIKADKKRLIPRNKREVSKKIHFWRVVKEGGVVVACGCFDAYSGRMAEIRSFIVRKDMRGKGYAKAILKDLLKLARPSQQVFVVTSVPKFFQKNNFDTCLGEKYIMFYSKKHEKKD